MTVTNLPTPADTTSIRRHPETDLSTGVRRFQIVCVCAIGAAAIPYLWVLWDLWTGTINPLRSNGVNDIPIYDAQARAIMHGHLWVANGSISFEAWIHGGHQYTYFGIFPSLIRIPIFLFTSSLDGRLTPLSMFAAWVVTALFSSLLLWRLRILFRGDAPLGWWEATSYAVLLASILVGSVLVYLASIVDYTSEDEAWSIALAIASLFALVGVLERPSWRRVMACGILVLLTNLNRLTTGYTACLAALLIGVWFASGRAGPERRRWALPMIIAGLVPLAVGCAIDLAKFGQPFAAPVSDDTLYRIFGWGRVNGGQFYGLRYVPSTLQAYVDPANFRFSSIFPFIVFPDIPGPIAHTTLFTRAPTASVPVSMPLLFFFGLWGVVVAFSRGLPQRLRGVRILLITSMLAAGTIIIFGWILERYAADLMPLLVLAGMIGMIDVWRRMDVGRSSATTKGITVVVVLLALFGFWTNMSFAVTPGNPAANDKWSETQLANFINVQRTFSDLTGHPLDNYVVVGSHFPSRAALGTLYIKGNCAKLFIADENVTPGPSAILNQDWVKVEQAPHAPICHSLVTDGRVRRGSRPAR
jgi:hypothetical protein